MDRVEFLSKYSRHYGALYRAFVQALSPKEACVCFMEMQDASCKKLNYLLQKIATDAGQEYQPCHQVLVAELINRFEIAKYQQRNIYAYALEAIYRALPEELQWVVIEHLLKSKYIPIRRRAYGILNNEWKEVFIPILEEAWNVRQDPACVEVIIDRFPPEFLAQHIEALCSIVPRHHMTRLFLKASEHDSNIIELLQGVDDITYVYILQKKGRILSDSNALKLFTRNLNDEHVGLLLWCFGRMGLWKVLVKIFKDLQEGEFSFRYKDL